MERARQGMAGVSANVDQQSNDRLRQNMYGLCAPALEFGKLGRTFGDHRAISPLLPSSESQSPSRE
jgi:hypothetical protein